jgi:hypothetical protein
MNIKTGLGYISEIKVFFSREGLMKKHFPGYYRPTEQEFKKLWADALFILDANVLLNLYRYSWDTSKDFLDILKHVSDRLWVPHQAAHEYQKNRLNVIATQREAYESIVETLTTKKNELENELNSYIRHPLIDVNRLSSRVGRMFNRIIRELRKQRKIHPDLLQHDTIRDEVTAILKDRIGSSYDEKRMPEIFKEGSERYDKLIPPGYLDSNKQSEEEKYADLIVWFQVIDKAKQTKKPVIFVTDDGKEDWWWRFQGKIIGPRPELVEEIRIKANVAFYMYRSNEFMKYAREHLNQEIDQKAIDEVTTYGEEKERALHRSAILSLHLGSLMTELDHLEKQMKQCEADEDKLSALLGQYSIRHLKLSEEGKLDESKRLEKEIIKMTKKFSEVEKNCNDIRTQHDYLVREVKRLINFKRKTLGASSTDIPSLADLFPSGTSVQKHNS